MKIKMNTSNWAFLISYMHWKIANFPWPGCTRCIRPKCTVWTPWGNQKLKFPYFISWYYEITFLIEVYLLYRGQILGLICSFYSAWLWRCSKPWFWFLGLSWWSLIAKELFSLIINLIQDQESSTQKSQFRNLKNQNHRLCLKFCDSGQPVKDCKTRWSSSKIQSHFAPPCNCCLKPKRNVDSWKLLFVPKHVKSSWWPKHK